MIPRDIESLGLTAASFTTPAKEVDLAMAEIERAIAHWNSDPYYLEALLRLKRAKKLVIIQGDKGGLITTKKGEWAHAINSKLLAESKSVEGSKKRNGRPPRFPHEILVGALKVMDEVNAVHAAPGRPLLSAGDVAKILASSSEPAEERQNYADQLHRAMLNKRRQLIKGR